MSRSKAALYDEDDLYDYDEEEDFYGDYGDYDAEEQKAVNKPAVKVLLLLSSLLHSRAVSERTPITSSLHQTEACSRCPGPKQKC